MPKNSMAFDVVIRGGRIVDGTGNAWFYSDVGVKNGKIEAVGPLNNAKTGSAIDASGLVVCPGFIDIHSHVMEQLLETPGAQSKIRQGITTMVDGNCGVSAAPRRSDAENWPSGGLPLYRSRKPDWSTFEDLYGTLESRGIALNAASFVGSGTIREYVIGLEDRKPTADELNKMRKLTEEAMDHGVFGLSSGLAYPPGSFADTEEIAALAQTAAERGGIYSSHVRGMGHTIFEAVREAVSIGQRAGLPVQISHLNIGPPAWGRISDVVGLMERARERGTDVTADTLVHNESVFAGGSLLPGWINEGGLDKLLERLGDPDMRARVKAETLEYGDTRGGSVASCLMQEGHWDKLRITLPTRFLGKSLAEIALNEGTEDPYDALLDLIIEERGNVRGVTEPYLQEDVDFTVAHPLCTFLTDGQPISIDEFSPPPMHRRTFGTFARVFGHYVRDRKIIGLEEAVRKSTSLAARRIGLKDRGLLMEGMWADITVMNSETIRETGTLENPAQYPEGIEYVLVNGRIVVDRTGYTGALPGKVLKG